MSRLCFIDLDGVIVDSTGRFEQATAAKRIYLDINSGQMSEDALKSGATEAYWNTAFDPGFVPLDGLIENAVQYVRAFGRAEWSIVYLTSRPESMREATTSWLTWRGLPDVPLVMKSPVFKYTKTSRWKADVVAILTSYHNASEVVVIDDEHANRVAIGFQCINCRTYENLAEAVAKEVLQ